jgi:hypothetical protein
VDGIGQIVDLGQRSQLFYDLRGGQIIGGLCISSPIIIDFEQDQLDILYFPRQIADIGQDIVREDIGGGA